MRFVYVANSDSDDVSMYTADAATGALTEIAPAVSAGDSPRDLTVDPTGRFVYVAESAGGGTTVVRKEVSVGQIVADGIEVFSGLSDGDKVITAGLNQIQDGQSVRLMAQN